MMKAKRLIDPRDFSAIPRTRELIDSLPEVQRVCRIHGETTSISESDFCSCAGAGPPFAKAEYVGCCNRAIDRLVVVISAKPGTWALPAGSMLS